MDEGKRLSFFWFRSGKLDKYQQPYSGFHLIGKLEMRSREHLFFEKRQGGLERYGDKRIWPLLLIPHSDIHGLISGFEVTSNKLKKGRRKRRRG